LSQFDVVVAGNGPAGASAAFRLALSGIKVGIVGVDTERGAPPAQTFPPQFRRAISELGIRWRTTADIGLESFGIDALWGGTGRFHSHMFDVDGNGIHVDRRAFCSRLLEEAIKQGAQVVLPQAAVAAVERKRERWTVVMPRGSSIECRFLVDATGRASAIARCLGSQRRRLDKLCGVATVVNRTSPLQTLSVEATENGWWYSAPFSGNRTIVCFMSDVDIIRSLGADRVAIWTELLANTRLSRHLEVPVSAKLRTLPCETSTLSETVGSGWIAIGDASSVLDPLASAGVVKAICDARTAADGIAAYLSTRDTTLLEHQTRRSSFEFDRYLANRRAQYRLEARWPNAPFWTRRQH